MSRARIVAFLSGILLCLGAGHAGATKPQDPHKAAFQRVHDQIKALQDACDKDAKAWEPRLQLAEMAMQYGLKSMALKRLDEAIELKPDHVPLYELAGKARFQLKEYDKAIELWQTALKLKPDDAKLQSWIAQAKEHREDDAALAKLEATLEKEPSDGDARLARARIRFKRGEWKEALADLAEYLKAKPDDAEALGMAAMASFRLDQLAEAIAFWDRAAKADVENQEYPLRLKQAQQLKETRDALAQVQEKLAREPNDGKLRLEAGELWATLGRHDYAALNLEQAVRWMPEDPVAHRLYGLVLMRLGRMEQALKALETCVKLDPDNAENKALLENARKTSSMHKAMQGMKHPGGMPGHEMPPGHAPVVPSPGTQHSGDSEK